MNNGKWWQEILKENASLEELFQPRFVSGAVTYLDRNAMLGYNIRHRQTINTPKDVYDALYPFYSRKKSEYSFTGILDTDKTIFTITRRQVPLFFPAMLTCVIVNAVASQWLV